MWTKTRWYPLLISRGWWFGVCCTAVTLILFWRRPDAFYNPQLWAEDGGRFFTTAFFGGLRSLIISFAGYYHFGGRLVAYAGSWLPVQYVPHWYAFSSWTLLIALIAYIFHPRIPGNTAQKFLMGLGLVATTADNEVFFNLANWPTVTSLFLVVLAISADPESKPARTTDFGLLLAAGLNSPFVIVLWPLFLLRWWLRRTPHNFWLTTICIVVAVIQFWNMPARNALNASPFTADPLFVDVIVYRFGSFFMGEVIDAYGLTLFLRVVGLMVVISFYGSLLWFAMRQRNWPVIFILVGGLLCWLLSLYVMRHNLHYMAHWFGRHYYIPAVTTAWALLQSKLRPSVLQWAPLGLSFVAFLFLTPASKNQVYPDLDWSGQVALCTGTKPSCRIPINPVWDPPAWFAYMNSRVFTEPAVQSAFSARFGSVLTLHGYDFAQTDTQVILSPVWSAVQKMDVEYTFFAHLYSIENPERIHSQVDQVPLDSTYPTTKWAAGEFVMDVTRLSIADFPPGEYRIGIGWYDPLTSSQARLAVTDSLADFTHNRLVLPIKITIPPPDRLEQTTQN